MSRAKSLSSRIILSTGYHLYSRRCPSDTAPMCAILSLPIVEGVSTIVGGVSDVRRGELLRTESAPILSDCRSVIMRSSNDVGRCSVKEITKLGVAK